MQGAKKQTRETQLPLLLRRIRSVAHPLMYNYGRPSTFLRRLASAASRFHRFAFIIQTDASDLLETESGAATVSDDCNRRAEVVRVSIEFFDVASSCDIFTFFDDWLATRAKELTPSLIIYSEKSIMFLYVNTN